MVIGFFCGKSLIVGGEAVAADTPVSAAAKPKKTRQGKHLNIRTRSPFIF